MVLRVRHSLSGAVRLLALAGLVVAAVACAGTDNPDPAPSAARPTPTAPPAPARSRPPVLTPPAYASRVVVASLGIDLPVISGDLQPPPNYPFCDVASYITRFSQPYEAGVTYLSAHAQKGMFLPLLTASRRAGGRELIGKTVEVYTSDGVRYRYAIDRVVPHAVDYGVVATLPLEDRWLVLQTSEGPFGTKEKLQVVATPVDETAVDLAEANPEAKPRDCRPTAFRNGNLAGPTVPPLTVATVQVAAPTPPWRTVAPPADGAGSPPATSGGLTEAATPSRVVVEELGIDLPVVSGDLQPPPNYPYCDVAAYLAILARPGEPGTTWLLAHSQEGMFLPLLAASERNNGRELLGMTADVYTTDELRHRYEIWLVRRHITDRSVATYKLQPGEHRLVLQTSEGPDGTVGRLAVAARLRSIERVDRTVAVPEARPRDCRPASAQTP